MHLAERDRKLRGAVVTRRPLACPGCGAEIGMDVIHYIDYCSEASRLLPLLFEQEYYVIECIPCHRRLESDWVPVIIELGDIGLLVFATPGVDDGGVESGFTHYFISVFSYLDDERRQRVQTSPFTIVYGAGGLASLLEAFGIPTPRIEPSCGEEVANCRARPFWKWKAGLPKMWNVPYGPVGQGCDINVKIEGEAEESPIRILHYAEKEISIETLDGYWYGELFFLYPKQLLVRSVVHVFLALAELASDPAARQELYNVFGEVPFAELDHPWVLQELGRLAVESDPDASGSFLERALRARHAWLAVTANVLDATPRRRQEDEAINPTLSASELKHDQQRIDAVRHTLIRMRPAKKDFGRWHFPFSENCAQTGGRSILEIGRVFGHALRGFELFFREQDLSWGRGAAIWWHEAVESALELLSNEEFELGFWEEYFPVWAKNESSPAEIRQRISRSIETRVSQYGKKEPVSRLWTAALQRI